MRHIARLAFPAVTATMVLAGSVVPVHAAPNPYWDRTTKCNATDPDGRKIPTRVGNGELGWNHFSGKHNIKKCALVNIPLQGNVDQVSGSDIQYWGWASNRAYGRVQLIVKARYARKTADKRYDAGSGNVVGVITAYCKGMTKCPNWVNE